MNSGDFIVFTAWLISCTQLSTRHRVDTPHECTVPSALYTGALDVQGASVTSMHFRALVCTLRTMVHAYACECKLKVELYCTKDCSRMSLSSGSLASNREVQYPGRTVLLLALLLFPMLGGHQEPDKYV